MHCLGDYDINVRIVMALQYLGGGAAAANAICGILGLSHKAFNRWTELEESITSEQIILGEEVLVENLEKEKEYMTYSSIDHLFYASLSIDCGWLKRSSGRRYDSSEGHSIVVGNVTRRVVAIHSMSKHCSKCSAGKEHPPSLCPKNWNGTSKAMAGHGTVINAK